MAFQSDTSSRMLLKGNTKYYTIGVFYADQNPNYKTTVIKVCSATFNDVPWIRLEEISNAAMLYRSVPRKWRPPQWAAICN